MDKNSALQVSSNQTIAKDAFTGTHLATLLNYLKHLFGTFCLIAMTGIAPLQAQQTDDPDIPAAKDLAGYTLVGADAADNALFSLYLDPAGVAEFSFQSGTQIAVPWRLATEDVLCFRFAPDANEECKALPPLGRGRDWTTVTESNGAYEVNAPIGRSQIFMAKPGRFAHNPATYDGSVQNWEGKRVYLRDHDTGEIRYLDFDFDEEVRYTGPDNTQALGLVNLSDPDEICLALTGAPPRCLYTVNRDNVLMLADGRGPDAEPFADVLYIAPLDSGFAVPVLPAKNTPPETPPEALADPDVAPEAPEPSLADKARLALRDMLFTEGTFWLTAPEVATEIAAEAGGTRTADILAALQDALTSGALADFDLYVLGLQLTSGRIAPAVGPFTDEETATAFKAAMTLTPMAEAQTYERQSPDRIAGISEGFLPLVQNDALSAVTGLREQEVHVDSGCLSIWGTQAAEDLASLKEGASETVIPPLRQSDYAQMVCRAGAQLVVFPDSAPRSDTQFFARPEEGVYQVHFIADGCTAQMTLAESGAPLFLTDAGGCGLPVIDPYLSYGAGLLDQLQLLLAQDKVIADAPIDTQNAAGPVLPYQITTRVLPESRESLGALCRLSVLQDQLPATAALEAAPESAVEMPFVEVHASVDLGALTLEPAESDGTFLRFTLSQPVSLWERRWDTQHELGSRAGQTETLKLALPDMLQADASTALQTLSRLCSASAAARSAR